MSQNILLVSVTCYVSKFCSLISHCVYESFTSHCVCLFYCYYIVSDHALQAILFWETWISILYSPTVLSFFLSYNIVFISFFAYANLLFLWLFLLYLFVCFLVLLCLLWEVRSDGSSQDVGVWIYELDCSLFHSGIKIALIKIIQLENGVSVICVSS